MESLGINDVYKIEKNPDKPNLMYVLTYINKDAPIKDVFSRLIEEMKLKQVETERTLIYCQTRKQCAVLYRLFQVELGESMFYKECQPCNRMVEMFHAGTPNSVKEHITKNLSQEDGHIRILIATIAFGMGVDCKKVRRTVHFCPSKNIENFVQEAGRAGRDGQKSSCTLLYNGLLSANCEKDIKEFLQSSVCRRKSLMIHFGYNVCCGDIKNHLCCDVCASQSECNCDDCGKHLYFAKQDESAANEQRVVREPLPSQRSDLKEKLISYQNEMHSRVRNQHNSKVPVCPTVLLEFNMFHIQQVLDNCHQLFNLDDILEKCEIWNKNYAKAILKILAEVFDDIDGYDFEESIVEDDTDSSFNGGNSPWDEMRNDSSLLDSFNFDDTEIMDYESDESLDLTLSEHTFNNSLFESLIP